MIIKTQGGYTYKADSIEELIEKMYVQAGAKENTLEDFMKNVSKRNKIYMGKEFNYTSKHEFVMECIRYGIIIKVETETSTIIRGDF